MATMSGRGVIPSRPRLSVNSTTCSIKSACSGSMMPSSSAASTKASIPSSVRCSSVFSASCSEIRTEEGIEALVEAAEEEGIIEPEQADLIEQVVEFSDKRVREVMTPRPDIVAIHAEATLEELHAKVVETKFSKIPVYEKSLDD